jgi:hypothetical protein
LETVSLKVPPSIEGGSGNAGVSGTAATGGNDVHGMMSAQEFCCGVKRDIAHYTNFKDDKHFPLGIGSLLQLRICTIHTLFWTQNMFLKMMLLRLLLEKCRFYVCCHGRTFKTDIGKSLLSQYDHDAQSIYHDLKKHAFWSQG